MISFSPVIIVCLRHALILSGNELKGESINDESTISVLMLLPVQSAIGIPAKRSLSKSGNVAVFLLLDPFVTGAYNVAKHTMDEFCNTASKKSESH